MIVLDCESGDSVDYYTKSSNCVDGKTKLNLHKRIILKKCIKTIYAWFSSLNGYWFFKRKNMAYSF